MTPAIIYKLSKNDSHLETILSEIVRVHAACIEYDHTQATFLPPLDYSKMLNWWNAQFAQTLQGTRHIWVELLPISTRTAQLQFPLETSTTTPITLKEHPGKVFEVAGVVSLYMQDSETGAFRGEVHKLLTSPNHRRKGVARRLMSVLEKTALEEGRWNIMLGTEVGSPAEQVYPRFGYIRVGVIPEHGYSPVKGKLCDEVWFYKDLKKQGTL